MLRILNINDESALSEEIIASFRLSGFNVDMTRLGLVGVTRAISHSYDVVVLDEALPDLASSTIISALRGAGVQTPVIMVSSTSDFAQRATPTSRRRRLHFDAVFAGRDAGSHGGTGSREGASPPEKRNLACGFRGRRTLVSVKSNKLEGGAARCMDCSVSVRDQATPSSGLFFRRIESPFSGSLWA